MRRRPSRTTKETASQPTSARWAVLLCGILGAGHLLVSNLSEQSVANFSNALRSLRQQNEPIKTIEISTTKKEEPVAVAVATVDPPREGDRWKIFRPRFHTPEIAKETPLVGNAKAYITYLVKRLDWLDTVTFHQDVKNDNLPKARNLYIEIIKEHVLGYVYGPLEGTVLPRLGQAKVKVLDLERTKREAGLEFPYLADTMVGSKRLDNIQSLLEDVMAKDIPGGYIETGVWRGGASIFARAVIHAHGEEKNRKSYVCDSFQGLPPGDRGLDKRDKGWDHTSYLEINEAVVAESFQKYALLDENVIFAKGFFNETMPHLAPQVDKLAVMRLDGDIYESTVDVLYHLYDTLSVGGYVIIDDWTGYPAKTACEDFFKVHKIAPVVNSIDGVGAYWQKTQDVHVQYWRYQQNKFKLFRPRPKK